MNRHNEALLEEYRKTQDVYRKLGETAVALLQKKIAESSIMVLQLSHRVKTESSLAGKLERKGDRYQALTDLTDLLGIRVICYFADDVDRIAELVETLFAIDRANSVDKRKILNDDQFGYVSLHYICSLTPDQCDEASLCTLRFEIQIRSVLQHAWAEINHDIGYKNTTGVPHSIIREFSRIAGLLEIADDQFSQIRDSVRQYREDSVETVRKHDLTELPVNEITLHAYFDSDPSLQAFFRDRNRVLVQDGSEDSTERLNALNILTMEQFSALVQKYLPKAIELADYENDAESTKIGTEQLVRLLIEACLSDSPDPESEVHSYMTRYYRDPEIAERREKDLLKYIKRLNKGKSAKRKGSDFL